METLPVEMVFKIGQKLTTKELTRCCGVSREWRELFNQGSTLAPLCRWRVTFLREKHLWSNWKLNNFVRERLTGLKNEICREFMSNTLIVRWLTDSFEVWDVSTTPAVFVAQMDPSVSIEGWIGCYVEKGLLIVRQIENVKVFLVDVDNQIIRLKQNILLEDVGGLPLDSEYHQELMLSKIKGWEIGLDCVKGNLFIHINARRLNLDIFDLETGLKIKEEACPFPQGISNKKNVQIMKVTTSLTSDFMIVTVNPDKSNRNSSTRNVYVYNLQKLHFIQDCLTSISGGYNTFLYSHYFAVQEDQEPFNKTVFDCHSFKALFTTRGNFPRVVGFYKRGSDELLVYKQSVEMLAMCNLKSPPLKLAECRTLGIPKVISNRLLVLFSYDYCYILLENVWVKCNLGLFLRWSVIHQAFTKVLSNAQIELKELNIYHYW